MVDPPVGAPTERDEPAPDGPQRGNVVRVPRRDAVLKKLHDDGIGAGVHYPVPIHLEGAFAHLGHRRGDFPVAERAAEEILSLPLFPEITTEQQECVAAALRRALA